jgi:hypothetical protein
MHNGAKRSGFISLAAAAVGLLGAVSAPRTDTLRLNVSHPFDVRVTARDQRTGKTASGQPLPQNDLFGYFSLPDLTGDPKNPEVFVKLLDGTTINGQYWVFYGHLTDLEYTLSVTEVGTGNTKTYHKDPGNSAGGFDTAGFKVTPTPATTATPTAPAPTATPTPPAGGAVTINVSLARYGYTPGTATPINVTAGVPTTLNFTADDTAHGFSGIAALGIAGSDHISPEIPPGNDGYGYTTPGSPAVEYHVTFTAPVSARGQTFTFYCNVGGAQGCGTGHSTMTGSLRVN